MAGKPRPIIKLNEEQDVAASAGGMDNLGKLMSQIISGSTYQAGMNRDLGYLHRKQHMASPQMDSAANWAPPSGSRIDPNTGRPILDLNG